MLKKIGLTVTKRTLEDFLGDFLQARMIANANGKAARLRSEHPFAVNLHPSNTAFPLFATFSPFDLAKQNALATRDASKLLTNWLQRLRADPLTSFSLPVAMESVIKPSAILQTHPLAINLTRIAKYLEDGGLLKNVNYERKDYDANFNNYGTEINHPKTLISAEKDRSKESASEESIKIDNNSRGGFLFESITIRKNSSTQEQ
ncbi:unnamed protein product [Thelazia callipaeda]|uniref:Uncharacterized protein n=1 Tax=Thelazia callipaeda TaxID=103827 RepID=A0A0N5CST5_THECL|nr:unnamed protein product [Thelazia callipaeda]